MTRTLFGSVLLCLGLAGPIWAELEFPKPPEGQATTATVALYRYQKQTCDDAAVRLIDFWKGDGNPQRTQQFILESLGPELASASAASDIIKDLLPLVRSEKTAEIHAVLTRLNDAGTQICNEVAQAEGNVSDFQQTLARIYQAIELNEGELGRLVVLPDAQAMDALLEPFLRPIQVAAIEAEAEYLAYLRSKRPKEKKITLTDRMVAWHQQTYLPAVSPVKAILGRYLAARNKNDGKGMTQACRELNTTIIPILREGAIFKTPDPMIDAPLKRIYVDLRNLAIECTAGRFVDADSQYATMQSHLQEAARKLGIYGLKP